MIIVTLYKDRAKPGKGYSPRSGANTCEAIYSYLSASIGFKRAARRAG
jgi:hypothetical protein